MKMNNSYTINVKDKVVGIEISTIPTKKIYKLNETSDLLTDVKTALAKLVDVTEKGGAMEEGKNQAVFYRDEVKTAMDALREPVDKLEMIVDKEMWPMPSYGDLIFEV